MNEDLFVSLLDNYAAAKLSPTRVISDPNFKAMPIEDRVYLLKKYANRIHQQSAIDGSFLKDVALGSVGVAIAAAPIVKSFGKAIEIGADMREEFDQTGKFVPRPVPLNMGDVSVFSLGAGVSAKPLSNAKQFLRDRGLVKRYLASGNPSTENAIDVIART